MKSLYFPLDAKVSLFRLKIKIKQIIPQRVVEYSFNFQTNPIQKKKKNLKTAHRNPVPRFH